MKFSSFSNLLLPVLLAFSVSAGIQAQPQTQPEENRYVVVPPDFVFLMIASQPGSPIGFKDMKLLVRIDNRRSAVSGKIYNAGTKPIRYVSLMEVGSSGAVSTLRGSGPRLYDVLGNGDLGAQNLPSSGVTEKTASTYTSWVLLSRL
jgi:hypothetical protein